MSDKIDFYALEPQLKILMLEGIVNRGKCIDVSGGMCGEIYIFDQGEIVTPRYVCAKVPKLLGGTAPVDIAQRFVAEMEKQLSFYHHMFVHWASDFKSVLGVPVAIFRYWGSDLDKLIRTRKSSIVVFHHDLHTGRFETLPSQRTGCASGPKAAEHFYQRYKAKLSRLARARYLQVSDDCGLWAF